MAQIRKKMAPPDPRGRRRVKGYYAEFYDRDRDPAQVRFSLRTKDAQAARQKLARLERAYAAGEFDPWDRGASAASVAGRSATVPDAIEEYVGSRALSLAKSSLDTDRSVLGQFDRSLPPGVLVGHVRRDHVDAYLATVANPSTRNSYRERVRAFLRWAKGEGLRRGDDPVPPPGRGRQERRKRLPRHYTPDELGRLLAHLGSDGSAAATRMGEVVVFAVGTGLRRGEICALRWADVDLAGRVLRVAHTEDASPKSGRERAVPLTGDALAVVARRHEGRGGADGPHVFPGANGGKFSTDYLTSRFAVYRKRAGLKDGLTFHGLRHTFATFAVERGMDLYQLKEIMGHADIKTTMVYARLGTGSLTDSMDRCFGSGVLACDRSGDLERENAELRREVEALRGARGAWAPVPT